MQSGLEPEPNHQTKSTTTALYHLRPLPQPAEPTAGAFTSRARSFLFFLTEHTPPTPTHSKTKTMFMHATFAARARGMLRGANRVQMSSLGRPGNTGNSGGAPQPASRMMRMLEAFVPRMAANLVLFGFVYVLAAEHPRERTKLARLACSLLTRYGAVPVT